MTRVCPKADLRLFVSALTTNLRVLPILRSFSRDGDTTILSPASWTVFAETKSAGWLDRLCGPLFYPSTLPN
jgi:hypothetical protein